MILSGSILWPFDQLRSQAILGDRLWCDGKRARNSLFIMRSFLWISFFGIFRWLITRARTIIWKQASEILVQAIQICLDLQLQLDITAYSFSLIFPYPPVSIKAVVDFAVFPSTNNPILAERSTQNGPWVLWPQGSCSPWIEGTHMLNMDNWLWKETFTWKCLLTFLR